MIIATIKKEVLTSEYIKDVNFAVYTDDTIYKKNDFDFSETKTEHGFCFNGKNDKLDIKWIFDKTDNGYIVSIKVNKNTDLKITRIDNFILELDKKSLDENMVIPHLGASKFGFAGNKLICDLKPQSDVRITGLFADTSQKGFMIAELLPLKFLYKIRIINKEDTISFEAFTKFTEGFYDAEELESQKTLVFDNCTIPEGMEHIKNLLPRRKKYVPKAFGWNSWDYYFASVKHEDIMENLEFIKNDKVLSENIKYITIDDGWQHLWGEWIENYKFEKGMKYTADKIKEAGFVPGIWVAPIQIVPFCDIALWQSDMLLKDDNRDPYFGTVTNQFNVDPTHPEGKKHIEKIFKKLYNDGYRLFKIDFLCQFSSDDDFKDNIHAKYFYDKNAGPYDALRELFRIIRECVTEESHIIGCSLPVECGADLVDSARISIDMHNWHACTEKVTDSMEWAYIYQGTVWNNDVDFLVVRGPETSTESEKERTNHIAQRKDYRSIAPQNPEKLSDFTYIQARTWANLVMISGGNIFLSDKMTALNDKGLELVRKAVSYKSESPVKPVYLNKELKASLWVTDDAALIVNWSDAEKEFVVLDRDIPFDVKNVKDLYTNEKINFKDGKLIVKLAAYDSLMMTV